MEVYMIIAICQPYWWSRYFSSVFIS